VSNILKSSCDPGSISTALRLDMVKLTNLTEEFAILLHVSSTSIPHSNSPTSKFSTTSLSPHSQAEDNQLSSSLSRTRNAHPAHSSSPPHSTPANGTYPTVLTAPAKNLNARRLRHTRETLNDSTVTDPG
jgi:hypothetical protein